jgi:hypothetical protein
MSLYAKYKGEWIGEICSLIKGINAMNLNLNRSGR